MNMSLIPSFKDSLLEGVDIGTDLIEVGIDSCLDDGIIKDIPFVNTLVKLGNIAVSIRERHLLQKTLAFIQEINKGLVSDDDRSKHKEKLESNPKKMEKELGYLLICIDRHTQVIQSKILARFYAAYLDPTNGYSWEDFCVLSEILGDTSIYDFDALQYIYENEPVNSFDTISLFQVSRLEKDGLIYRDYNERRRELSRPCIRMCPQGKVFCELGRIEEFITTKEGDEISVVKEPES